MNKIIYITLFSMISVLIQAQNIREKINFDFNWKFILEDISDASKYKYNDDNWQTVQLPHDWSIKQPVAKENGEANGFLPGGIGWYRKAFDVPVSYKNKKVTIQFDGVYHQSDVYINGKHLGFHPYGYTTFEYDLTPFLKYGKENTIAVRVDHSDSPSSRWYSGSGIYRHVWLKVTNLTHVSTWGTYITTPKITEKKCEVNIVTSLENNQKTDIEALVSNRVIDKHGNLVAENESKVTIAKSAQSNLAQTVHITNPKLWSIEEPYLYTMETIVKVNGISVDEYTTPLGVRTIRFDANNGFFLNGKNLKMKGVNLHPDAGALGVAIPEKSFLRRLKILKEYGVNAIRCSHNPPTTEFLNMCDSLGFVVIDEAFDKWKGMYYTKYFDEWWERDLEAMVLRDRNHPSIVLWSIGNETWEQFDMEGEGTKRAKMLRDHVHKIEPSRLVTVALQPDKQRRYNKNGFAESLDVVGYNYQEQWLHEEKKNYPEKIMYISEAYPFYRGKDTEYKAFYPVNPWYDVANNDFVFGQFIWAGVDYLGESTGWPSTGWVTCPFDVCMFEKPSAAFHRSVWNDEPMVSIAVADQSLDIDPGKPHWSWPFLAAHWNFTQYEGHVIKVVTTTNCDSVKLELNGKSLGFKKRTDFPNNTIEWFMPYEKGRIEATGYKNGEEVTDSQLKTAGEAAKIEWSVDQTSINADGQDLAHIALKIVDKDGVVVPDYDEKIAVEITGNGRLLALDNGDLRRLSFNENTISPYFGKALVTVQSSQLAGELKVKLSTASLPVEEVFIKVK